jgi:hypothetical protein
MIATKHSQEPAMPTNEPLNRKLRMGLVGGGQGAFIGRVHATAAILDNRACLVPASQVTPTHGGTQDILRSFVVVAWSPQHMHTSGSLPSASRKSIFT